MKTFRHIPMPQFPVLQVEETGSGRYYTTPTGEKLPSMTTVLGHFDHGWLEEWQARVGIEEANRQSAYARNRGSKLHDLVERYVRNEEIDVKKLMPHLQQSFRDILPAFDNVDNVQYQQTQLWSVKLGVAGRCDLIADYCGTPAVIDTKTSARPKTEDQIQSYFEQTTGYALMYEELLDIPLDGIVIIMVNDEDSKPQVFVKYKDPFVRSLKEKIETYRREVDYVS